MIWTFNGGARLKGIVEKFSLVLYCRVLFGEDGRKETSEFLKIESATFEQSLTQCYARLAFGW